MKKIPNVKQNTGWRRPAGRQQPMVVAMETGHVTPQPPGLSGVKLCFKELVVSSDWTRLKIQMFNQLILDQEKTPAEGDTSDL